MSTMGSSCSTPRQRSSWNDPRLSLCREDDANLSSFSGGTDRHCRRSSRHSVVSAVPDDSIAGLYPLSDNYITDPNGTSRSPKTLADLCTDTLCRSLAYLDGELPKGIPQEVVDGIVASLLKHSALNATTLRVLRNCEIDKLSLAGCRGVTDEWLSSLTASTSTSSSSSTASQGSEQMDLEVYGLESAKHQNNDEPCPDMRRSSTVEPCEDSLCSTLSFVSATSSPCTHMSIDRDSFDSQNSPTISDYKSNSQHLEDDSKFTPQEFPNNTLSSNLTLLDLRGSHNLTDDGLLQLSNLSSLKIAKFDNCNFVGRGLHALSSSHQLHTLSLANCRRLTDDAIINISHLSSLEALSLGGCRCLTDRSLAAIQGLYLLSKLDLSQCDLITEIGIKNLKNLDKIEELSIGWCRAITDAGVDALTRQHGRSTVLKILRLARCSITDNGIESLGRLKALEELDLNGCSNVSSAALGQALSKMENLSQLDVSYCPSIIRTSWQGKVNSLKTLELCYSGVRDSHLSRLSSLPALEELNLDSCPVGDWAIAHLADNNVVPNLKSLDLADSDLTDAGMAHLEKLTNLTHLSLFYCNITNRGLRHLAKLTSLEVLNLDSRDIGDEGLRFLRNLKKLRSLDLFSGRITDTGCTYLSKITSLQSLELCGGGIGDLGCTRLALLENLTSLNLSQNERITNRGAAALAALSNLKALNLSNTRVDSGALVYLSALKKLQSVAFYGCNNIQDHEKLTRLQNGLPSLKCLRLNTASEEEGCIFVPDEDNTSEYGDDDAMSNHSGTRRVTARRSSDDHMDDDDESDDISGDSSGEYSDHD